MPPERKAPSGTSLIRCSAHFGEEPVELVENLRLVQRVLRLVGGPPQFAQRPGPSVMTRGRRAASGCRERRYLRRAGNAATGNARALQIERGSTPGIVDKRLDFGGERETVRRSRSSTGIFARASRAPAASSRVGVFQSAKAEHPFEFLDAAEPSRSSTRSTTSVSLSVRNATALGFERRAQGAVVIDLAVEDQHQPAVIALHRLMAVLTVDDGQAPHREADVRSPRTHPCRRDRGARGCLPYSGRGPGAGPDSWGRGEQNRQSRTPRQIP